MTEEKYYPPKRAFKLTMPYHFGMNDDEYFQYFIAEHKGRISSHQKLLAEHGLESEFVTAFDLILSMSSALKVGRPDVRDMAGRVDSVDELVALCKARVKLYDSGKSYESASDALFKLFGDESIPCRERCWRTCWFRAYLDAKAGKQSRIE